MKPGNPLALALAYVLPRLAPHGDPPPPQDGGGK